MNRVRQCAYPQVLIKRVYKNMKRKINLDAPEFQQILKRICTAKGVNINYVNNNAHIVAAGQSSLPINEQRLIANCVKYAMEEYDNAAQV